MPLVLHRASRSSAALWLLAEHFRNEPPVLPLLLDRASRGAEDLDAKSVLARYYAEDGRVLPALLTLAKTDDGMLLAVATHWPGEPRVLSLLLELIESDSAPLRRAALLGLARSFAQHRRTVPALLSHARNAADPWIQSAVVTALAESFPRDPFLLPLLSELIAHPEVSTRRAALVALVRLFPDHPLTLGHLRDRIANDPDEAIVEMAAHFVERFVGPE